MFTYIRTRFTNYFMDRSYQAENARSRPLPEAKLPWASPVVGWVTTCEPDVTICSFAHRFDSRQPTFFMLSTPGAAGASKKRIIRTSARLGSITVRIPPVVLFFFLIFVHTGMRRWNATDAGASSCCAHVGLHAH